MMGSKIFNVKCGKMERVTISYRESNGSVVAYKSNYTTDESVPMIFDQPAKSEPIISYYKNNLNNYIGNSMSAVVNLKIKTIIVNFNKDGFVRDIDVVI